jgi:hypothetical protein
MGSCTFPPANGRRRLGPIRIACAVLIAAIAVFGSAVCTAAHAAARATAITVYAEGAVPGIPADQLPQYIAHELTTLGLSTWTFAAGSPLAAPAADRIEWKFKPLPYANRGLVRIGRLLSSRSDLFGQYRYFRVETRLYLGGEFQTMSFRTAEFRGGANDPKLAALIDALTRSMLTVGLDQSSVPSPPTSPKPSRHPPQ